MSQVEMLLEFDYNMRQAITQEQERSRAMNWEVAPELERGRLSNK